MLRKSLIVTAIASLLATGPALARPTGGIWDKAPRIKRVKKPKPPVQVEQPQPEAAATAPAPQAPAANASPPAGTASNGASVQANNGAVCTAEKPC